MWFLGVIRQIFAFIDTVAFSLVEVAYNLIDEFSKAHFFDGEVVTQVRNNLYVIIGIFALFRIALILVNSIINPDKLNEKGNGVGNVLINLLIMFVLLVATPLIFNEALDLQETIVSGNYIQKMFLDPGSLEKLENPGKMMQSVAISSLITLNDDVVVDGTCTGECQDAVEEYEEMRKTGFTMPRIALYVDNKGTGSDGKKAFVYDYMILVTFAAGLFITYTLFKFAIDIAIRMVKLTALQILAPMFIATYIDPKYAKSGPFNNWLKEVGKTYISLFTRLAIVSIMLLLLALVDKVDLSGGIPKLLLLIAVLIFAKEAPKWIANLIGVSDDGLDGGILKKLGSAALIGGAITKGANALGGAAGGLASGAHNQLKNRRAQRKQIRDKEGLNSGAGKKARQARQDFYDKNGLSNAKYSDKVKALRDARSKAYAKENAGWNKDGNLAGLKQMGAAVGAGILLGGKAGIKSDGLKGSFKGGITAGNEFGQRVGMQGESIKGRIATGQESLLKKAEGTFGTAQERRERLEAIENAKKYNDFIGDRAFKTGNSADNIPVSQGGFNKAFLGASGGMDAVYAAMGKMASDPTLTGGTIKTNASGQIEITGTSGAKAVIDGNNLDSSMVKAGKDLFSSEGLANYEHMFAEAQKQALNSVMTNNAQMGALMQQKSSAEQSMDYNRAEAARAVTSAGLVQNGQITINGASINLSDATIEQMGAVVSAAAGSGKFPKAAMDDLQKTLLSFEESFKKSQAIAENTNEQIQDYQASNEKLGNMIQSLRSESEENKTKTLEALLADVERKVSKKKTDVDSFNAKKDDK